MKLAALRTDQEVLAQQLQDPAFRERWERTALARTVALRVLAYRVEHDLSQTQLAKRLGMKQPAIARLEAGEHTPSLATLIQLSRALGIEILVDIAPSGQGPTWVTKDVDQAEFVEKFTSDGSQVLVAAR